jgi:formylglycine-generating enzyme required for sulfatase activity
MILSSLKAGRIQWAAPPENQSRGTDEIQHRVTVSDFYIAKSQVTQRDYTALMGNNPSEFRGDNQPVENVTWLDVVRFCNARSTREGLTPAYTISRANILQGWDIQFCLSQERTDRPRQQRFH